MVSAGAPRVVDCLRRWAQAIQVIINIIHTHSHADLHRHAPMFIQFINKRLCLLVLLLMAALMPQASVAQKKTVAVLLTASHPAMESVLAGLLESLKQAGFAEPNGLKLEMRDAQADPARAAQFAKELTELNPDAIVALGSPAAQALVNATRRIPVVFSAVTDPVEANLVPAWQPSGTNVTGVSDLIPMYKQLDLIRVARPNARRIGMVHTQSEPNARTSFKQMQEAAAKAGMTLIDVPVTRSVSVGAAARSLIGKVDVLFVGTDHQVTLAMPTLAKVASDGRLPLFATDAAQVETGAAAAWAVDYRALGQQTGRMLVRVLKGTAPGAIAPETSARYQLVVNPKAAALQGVQLPESMMKNARLVGQ